MLVAALGAALELLMRNMQQPQLQVRAFYVVLRLCVVAVLCVALCQLLTVRLSVLRRAPIRQASERIAICSWRTQIVRFWVLQIVKLSDAFPAATTEHWQAAAAMLGLLLDHRRVKLHT